MVWENMPRGIQGRYLDARVNVLELVLVLPLEMHWNGSPSCLIQATESGSSLCCLSPRCWKEMARPNRRSCLVSRNRREIWLVKSVAIWAEVCLDWRHCLEAGQGRTMLVVCRDWDGQNLVAEG